jgi:hypothetical protein
MPSRARELGAPARLALFAAALGVIAAAAALMGAATVDGRAATSAVDEDEMAMDELSPAQRSQATGLSSVAGGYTLAPLQATLPRNETIAYRFRILDRGGRAVRDFDIDGGVRVHLIVVRRDLTGYQHLHPTLQADGTWSVSLTLPAAGAYRAFTDFEIDGTKIVLGHDLFVPGTFAPVQIPAASDSVAADEFVVSLKHDDLRADKEAKLRFAISKGGRPVPVFDPYVGHRGHLVALRDGDLSYSHVHPEPDARLGEIVFHTELPSAGRYRLFLQFKVDGVVHTAPFTVEVAR